MGTVLRTLGPGQRRIGLDCPTADRLIVMAVIAMGVYRQMKVKLTTARWQRDSLEQRLDSVKILDANNTSYFRYHTAEATDKNLEDQ